MKILVYGINYSPELTSTGKYNSEMARWFAAQGHHVRVVTTPPYYPDWKLWPGYPWWRYSTQMDQGVQVTRCPLYVPTRPGTITRLLHLMSFAITSAPIMLAQLFWRPKLIVLVVPTLFCAPQTLLISKLCGAKSVLHIQDFEVDAALGLGMARSGWLMRLAGAIEKLMLTTFDHVSTISAAMLARAQGKGAKPAQLVLFPNWSEIERFRNIHHSPALLQSLGIPAGKRIVLYAGAMGEKQGLELVLDAATHLQQRREIVFLMVGDGAAKQNLMQIAEQRRLGNVIFAAVQPYEALPSLLASADVHLVVQKRGGADTALPSKLTNILAAGGNAVITADPDTTLGKLCGEYPGIATLCEPESVEALADAIDQTLGMSRPNAIAQDYALNFLDKDHILRNFLADIKAPS